MTYLLPRDFDPILGVACLALVIAVVALVFAMRDGR